MVELLVRTYQESQANVSCHLIDRPKKMPNGEVVVSCSCTKGFVSRCFLFLLACCSLLVCLKGKLERTVMSCRLLGRRGARVPFSRSGVR